MRLGVNIDHIAYLREVRETHDPDPLHALHIAKLAGASQITIHLREDRRHIHDSDVVRIIESSQLPVNVECANDKGILKFICKQKPSRITLVPEKRQEVTTEGGLLLGDHLLDSLKMIEDEGIDISLFIDPNRQSIEHVAMLAQKINSKIAIELHTGKYANIYLMLNTNLSRTRHSIKDLELSREALLTKCKEELNNIGYACALAKRSGLYVYAGHGLDYNNVKEILQIKDIEELNIGQSIIARSIFTGLYKAIKDMVRLCESS